jgi:hypothetical protein
MVLKTKTSANASKMNETLPNVISMVFPLGV